MINVVRVLERGKAGLGSAGLGEAWRGLAWQGLVRLGSVGLGGTQLNKANFNNSKLDKPILYIRALAFSGSSQESVGAQSPVIPLV